MATAKTVIKNAFSASEKVVTENTSPSLTKQEFKKDTDLNVIMKKFQVTGAMDHVNMHSGNYGQHSPLDYHQAMTVVANANSMFADLPSDIRNKFDNQPEKFLEFVQSEDNYDEAIEMGIQIAPELHDRITTERETALRNKVDAPEQQSSEQAPTEPSS
jgi:phage internal scaffolding protein